MQPPNINFFSGLLRKFRIEHEPIEWRLFMDSSSSSFKGVLLHNENRNASHWKTTSWPTREHHKRATCSTEQNHYTSAPYQAWINVSIRKKNEKRHPKFSIFKKKVF